MPELERGLNVLTTGKKAPVKCGSQGLLSADGQVQAWGEVAPGRYELPHKPTDQWTVVFARVSLDEQVEHGWSLPQQVRFALEAGEKMGVEVSHVYLDPGRSATRLSFAQRPGISELMADIKRGVIGAVFVYKRDRIARQLFEWFNFLKACARSKVRVVFTAPGEPPLGEGVYGRFLETVLIAAAEVEAGVTGMRIRTCHLGLLKTGQYPGGNPPYGYHRRPDGTIEQVPEEAAVIARIYQLVALEKMGHLRVAMRLREEGLKSPKGKDWTPLQVHRVLRNRAYCGYLHLRTEGENQPKQYYEIRSTLLPAIVTEELWSQAQEVRSARRPLPKEEVRYGACARLLTGLAVCPLCGRRMYTRATANRSAGSAEGRREWRSALYRCNKALHMAGCANRCNTSANMADKSFLRALTAKLREFDAGALLAGFLKAQKGQQAALEVELRAAEAELSQVSHAVDSYHRELEQASESREEERILTQLRAALERRRELQARKDGLGQLIRKSADPSDEERALLAMLDWPSDFADLPAEAQRQLISRIIDRVVLDGAHHQLRVFFKFRLALDCDADSPNLLMAPILRRP